MMAMESKMKSAASNANVTVTLFINVGQSTTTVGTATLCKSTDNATIFFSARCTTTPSSTITVVIPLLFVQLSSWRIWSPMRTHARFTRLMSHRLILQMCTPLVCTRWTFNQWRELRLKRHTVVFPTSSPAGRPDARSLKTMTTISVRPSTSSALEQLLTIAWTSASETNRRKMCNTFFVKWTSKGCCAEACFLHHGFKYNRALTTCCRAFRRFGYSGLFLGNSNGAGQWQACQNRGRASSPQRVENSQPARRHGTAVYVREHPRQLHQQERWKVAVHARDLYAQASKWLTPLHFQTSARFMDIVQCLVKYTMMFELENSFQLLQALASSTGQDRQSYRFV